MRKLIAGTARDPTGHLDAPAEHTSPDPPVGSRGWFTVPNDFVDGGQLAAVKSLVALKALLVLRRFRQNDDDRAWCSLETLSEMTGHSAGSLSRGVQDLVDAGLIEVLERGRIGRATTYRFLDRANHCAGATMLSDPNVAPAQRSSEVGASTERCAGATAAAPKAAPAHERVAPAHECAAPAQRIKTYHSDLELRQGSSPSGGVAIKPDRQGSRQPAGDASTETPPPIGLFAATYPAGRVATNSTQKGSPQAELVAYFCSRWQQLYHGTYPTERASFVLASKLLKHAGGDLEAAKGVIDRYFASTKPFFVNAQHPLPMLLGGSVLPQFINANQPKGDRGHAEGVLAAGDVVRRGRDGRQRLEPANPLAGFEIAG